MNMRVLFLFALLSKFSSQLTLEKRHCKIRDVENFRDIYIKESSKLSSHTFQYEDGSSTLLVSLCLPLDPALLKKYSCQNDREYHYARIEKSIIQGKVVRVCATRIPYSSIVHFKYDKEQKVYRFMFNDRPEDEPMSIQFPYPNQSKSVVFERDEKEKLNRLKIKGSDSDLYLESGYLISDKVFIFYLLQIIISLLLIFRFGILSLQGVTYVSIFICGYRLKFFDFLVNFTTIFEVINCIFQLLDNPGTLTASLVVLILPLQMGVVIPSQFSWSILTGKFPHNSHSPILALFGFIKLTQLTVYYACFNLILLIPLAIISLILTLLATKLHHKKE